VVDIPPRIIQTIRLRALFKDQWFFLPCFDLLHLTHPQRIHHELKSQERKASQKQWKSTQTDMQFGIVWLS
jgi:hypothetical protein